MTPELDILFPGLDRGDIDSEDLGAVLQRKASGHRLRQHEARLLSRARREIEELLRLRFYASIPQKHWRAMSGRPWKVINEQAARYSIPFAGKTISLPDVARALHDHLAATAHLKKGGSKDDELLQGPATPGLERYRNAKAGIAELELEHKRGELIDRETMRKGLSQLAATLRDRLEMLRLQFGAAPADLIEEGIVEFERSAVNLVSRDVP